MKTLIKKPLEPLPEFGTRDWRWDEEEGKHYEGDHIRPNGVWLARFRDPYSRNPDSRADAKRYNLQEHFERVASSRLLLLEEAFGDLIRAKNSYRRFIKPKLHKQIHLTLLEEAAVVRRSFERANNHPFRVHITDEVLEKENEVMSDLEIRAAKVFFQLDQLRNCAKQDSYAYTVVQLSHIYSIIGRLIDHFARDVEGDSHVRIERKIGTVQG